MNKNKVFMAFGQGKESSEEGGKFPKYVGVGTFKVLAVNPTKEELEKLYGTTLEKEIEYTSKDDNNVDQVRLDFIVKTEPEKNNGIELITKVSFFLKNAPRLNTANTKVQVINAYGETTWIDLDMVKTGQVPENQAWFEAPYRPAFVGEEELTSFLKTYLAIPSKSYRDSKGIVHTIENKSDAEARLDNIPQYFKNNVKELQEVIKVRPDNLIKLALGVKTTNDNKEYQSVFTRMFLKNNVKDYSKLDAEIKNAQANGGYSNTVFSIEPLHEYVVNATTFEQPAAEELIGWFGTQPQ